MPWVTNRSGNPTLSTLARSPGFSKLSSRCSITAEPNPPLQNPFLDSDDQVVADRETLDQFGIEGFDEPRVGHGRLQDCLIFQQTGGVKGHADPGSVTEQGHPFAVLQGLPGSDRDRNRLLGNFDPDRGTSGISESGRSVMFDRRMQHVD